MAEPEVGGFDCEFVEKPPDGFPQTECPICQVILREPQLVSCCGYSYCESCINGERAMRGNRCSLCNQNYTLLPDKRLKRSLYDLRVYCSHRKHGCEWKGPLRDLDNHLNLRPSGRRMEGCLLVEIICIYCRNAFQRRRCEDHESKDCRQRPYTCQHCGYKATYEKITENHLPLCTSFPVNCPHCELRLKRQELEHHMANDCPLILISCDFHAVGCSVQLARKDMRSHIRCDLDQHTALLKEHMDTHPGEDMSMYVPLLVRSVDVYREFRHEKERKEEHIQAQYLLFILAMLVSDFIVAGAIKLAVVLGMLLAVFAVAQLTNVLQYFPAIWKSNRVQFTMAEFEKHKNAGDIWYSPSFYTHHRGYKMCVGVFANGFGDGHGTHVSVVAHLMPGHFDDELPWPFQGEVTVTLFNQHQPSGQKSRGVTRTRIIKFANKSDCATVHRVTSGSRGKGYGTSKFIAHSKLYNSQYQYLMNSCLIFEVQVFH